MRLSEVADANVNNPSGVFALGKAAPYSRRSRHQLVGETSTSLRIGPRQELKSCFVSFSTSVRDRGRRIRASFNAIPNMAIHRLGEIEFGYVREVREITQQWHEFPRDVLIE
jgi:hypothetical protein